MVTSLFPSCIGAGVEHSTFTSYATPTGHICTMRGVTGKPLEFLSLGDYGQQQNIKADFLGLGRELNGVPHGALLPLEKKWVITISPQYGCSMGCRFCDVPLVGPGVNATVIDMLVQVFNALSLHPEVEQAERINVHFARMGEPTFNPDVLDTAKILHSFFTNRGWGFHPVVSTMMPKQNERLRSFLYSWLAFKNFTVDGAAGLQISINTTDEVLRKQTMPASLSLIAISAMLSSCLEMNGLDGRKIALNFALTDAPIDAAFLRLLFDPKYFMCKITPMHNTTTAAANNLTTLDGYSAYYPYRRAEQALKEQGFDVLVFIPSKEEDESMITCGNAILAQTKEP